jgi:hypothetical protein
MRFTMIALFLTLQISAAQATCRVFVPVKIFDNSGYSIRFDFTKIFSEKGYVEVASGEEADHQLLIEGEEGTGNFHKAIAMIKMDDLLVKESVTCFTQYCGISDYAKSFNKAYNTLNKKLPTCR